MAIDMAFLTIAEASALIKSRQLSPVVSGDLKLLSGGQAQNVSGLLAVFFLTM